MDIAMIAELIGTLGFPIALVVAFCWFIFKIYKRSEQREDEMRQELKESREINGQFANIITEHTAELREIKTDIRDIKTTLEIGC